VSGISEASGVVGDGEREQAVTEEEDMIALATGGKGGLRCGSQPSGTQLSRVPPVWAGSQETDSWRFFR
jgi:hypothetical protein